MIGVPGPRLSPEFWPVIESTEFGRSLPRRVASATASRICWRIQIWFAPTGTWTSNVGMPVSWQIAPSLSTARSMFCAMIVSACDDRVPAGSDPSAVRIAARTSGGSSVDVLTMRSRTLSKKEGSIRAVYFSELQGAAARWSRGARGERLVNVETAYRVERDPLGEVKVPAAAYYGVQTARAIENFPISGLHAPPELVTATVAIKKAAAQANASLGRLDREIAAAIVAAADEILAGRLRDQF